MYENGMNDASATGFFLPGSVVWDLQNTEKEAAIQETILRSTPFHRVNDLDIEQFVSAVLTREREQTTGFGHGIAISHGRDLSFTKSTVSLGISRAGVEFNAFDGKPVHMLFVVGSHPDKQIDYLRILSSLAVLAHDKNFRSDVLGCLGQEEAQKKLYTAFDGVLQRTHAR